MLGVSLTDGMKLKPPKVHVIAYPTNAHMQRIC